MKYCLAIFGGLVVFFFALFLLGVLLLDFVMDIPDNEFSFKIEGEFLDCNKIYTTRFVSGSVTQTPTIYISGQNYNQGEICFNYTDTFYKLENSLFNYRKYAKCYPLKIGKINERHKMHPSGYYGIPPMECFTKFTTFSDKTKLTIRYKP